MNGPGRRPQERPEGTAFLWIWLPPALYVMGILFLALRPLPALPPVRDLDKYLHAVVYGVLAALLARAGAMNGFRHASLFAVALTLLVGLMDEGLQWWGGVRTADALDLMADGVGAVLGAIAWRKVRRTNRHRGKGTEA